MGSRLFIAGVVIGALFPVLTVIFVIASIWVLTKAHPSTPAGPSTSTG